MIHTFIYRALFIFTICLSLTRASYGMDVLCKHSSTELENEESVYQSIMKDNQRRRKEHQADRLGTIPRVSVIGPVCAGIIPKTAAMLKAQKPGGELSLLQRRKQREKLLAEESLHNYLLDFLNEHKADTLHVLTIVYS